MFERVQRQPTPHRPGQVHRFLVIKAARSCDRSQSIPLFQDRSDTEVGLPQERCTGANSTSPTSSSTRTRARVGEGRLCPGRPQMGSGMHWIGMAPAPRRKASVGGRSAQKGDGDDDETQRRGKSSSATYLNLGLGHVARLRRGVSRGL